MKREVRKLPDEELQEIKSLLVSVRESIRDNNQNTKDCLNLIQRIEQNLGIKEEKLSFFQRIRRFLSTK